MLTARSRLVQGAGRKILQGGSAHDHHGRRQSDCARHPESESLRSQLWDLLGHHSRTEARYTIRVPASFNADLDTAGGGMTANGLTGNVKVDTSGGDLNFSQIRGEIHGDTSGGDIEAKNCDGAIKLDTSGGRIEVTGGRGKLNVDTSGGNVTVLNRVGDTKVESSGGKLRLGNISGKLTAETSGGSVPPSCLRRWPATSASRPPVAASPSSHLRTPP